MFPEKGKVAFTPISIMPTVLGDYKSSNHHSLKNKLLWLANLASLRMAVCLMLYPGLPQQS